MGFGLHFALCYGLWVVCVLCVVRCVLCVGCVGCTVAPIALCCVLCVGSGVVGTEIFFSIFLGRLQTTTTTSIGSTIIPPRY